MTVPVVWRQTVAHSDSSS